MSQKILFIRFSSLGDIFQCLAAVDAVKSIDKDFEIHFLTRADFKELLELNPNIKHVHAYPRKSGFWGLLTLCRKLRAENYEIIYDAHNNLRSLLVKICLFSFLAQIIVRSKNRLRRYLFFKFRIKTFSMPFLGMQSYLQPLQKIFPHLQLAPPHPSLWQNAKTKAAESNIVFAPSAAWEMKRWPTQYWVDLAHLLSPAKIDIVAGPEDSFTAEIQNASPHRIHNLAGKISWQETFRLIAEAKVVIANDTGTLHIADYLGVPCIALIGPSAFGFPSRPTSRYLFQGLSCQPCSKDGRGKCSNLIYKKCLIDLNPQAVYATFKDLMRA